MYFHLQSLNNVLYKWIYLNFKLYILKTYFHPKYLFSLCIFDSKYWVHIPKLSFTDEKFESCIQDECCKPYKQVKFFLELVCLKTMIISDTIDFIKAISCWKTTHVSTKQRLSKKNATKVQKIWFLFFIYLFFFQYFLWVLKFQKNQLSIKPYTVMPIL